MSLIELAKEAFPETWGRSSSAEKAKAVSAVVSVLGALRRQYGSGQVDAVVKRLFEE